MPNRSSRKRQSIAQPSLASGWSRSTIWSSRARKRSFCPLSRRSLGRIESPSAKPTERQNHDQTTRSICKKRNQQRPLSCKRNNLTILGGASKIRRLRIVHGRLGDDGGESRCDTEPG